MAEHGFEPLKNDLILRAAWGERSDPMLPPIATQD